MPVGIAPVGCGMLSPGFATLSPRRMSNTARFATAILSINPVARDCSAFKAVPKDLGRKPWHIHVFALGTITCKTLNSGGGSFMRIFLAIEVLRELIKGRHAIWRMVIMAPGAVKGPAEIHIDSLCEALADCGFDSAPGPEARK